MAFMAVDDGIVIGDTPRVFLEGWDCNQSSTKWMQLKVVCLYFLSFACAILPRLCSNEWRAHSKLVGRAYVSRNRWCNFRPATARIKPSERHIGRPKPAICEASVSAATMTDILESSYRRTQSQPIGGSTWRLPERICVRCCVQHQAYNLLNRAAGNRLLVAIG